MLPFQGIILILVNDYILRTEYTWGTVVMTISVWKSMPPDIMATTTTATSQDYPARQLA